MKIYTFKNCISLTFWIIILFKINVEGIREEESITIDQTDSLTEYNENLSKETDLEEIFNAFRNATIGLESNLSGKYNATNKEPDLMKYIYRIIVPILLLLCFVTIVANLYILVAVKWIRRSLSPTLCFSISLAVADAYASLIIGIGLIINSLLPVGYGLLVNNMECTILIIEGFRLSGMIVSVLHLLGLAINHYIGIIKPLHYQATMTRRTAMIAIAFMWIMPFILHFVYFSSVKKQGFQSPMCKNLQFIIQSTFRITVSVMIFLPLFIMVFIYCHIFVIIRQHHKGLVQYQTPANLNKNIKAIITTLLILGTYIVGWMPAVLFFVITCLDCLIPFTTIDLFRIRVPFGFISNGLIVLKSFIDPIVYAARVKEIRSALRRMHKQYCHVIDRSPPATETSTTSIKLHSVYHQRSDGRVTGEVSYARMKLKVSKSSAWV